MPKIDHHTDGRSLSVLTNIHINMSAEAAEKDPTTTELGHAIGKTLPQRETLLEHISRILAGADVVPAHQAGERGALELGQAAQSVSALGREDHEEAGLTSIAATA